MPAPLTINDSHIDLEWGGIDCRVIDFLNSIDTGVCGFSRTATLRSSKGITFQTTVPEGATSFATIPELAATGDAQILEEIELSHRGKEGKEVLFPIDLESSGTCRMLMILSKVFMAIDEGFPVIVDELDLSLHTAASEAVLRLFCSRDLNQNGSQLLATTHDTNLIKSGLLRRDQIWFAEKDKNGSTDIYPLTDFRTRKDDNIELGYRQGRYGAIPTDDPVASLLGK